MLSFSDFEFLVSCFKQNSACVAVFIGPCTMQVVVCNLLLVHEDRK